MKVSELYEFVQNSDVARTEEIGKRERIATLGLVSEIGSVLSAVKKDILSLQGQDEAGQFLIRSELNEQIGDSIWYAIMLANCLDDPSAKNVFKADIEKLQRQLSGQKRDDKRVQAELNSERKAQFLLLADQFLAQEDPEVDAYQRTAYFTRRTEREELRNVCAAVLQQLAAQLSRDFLPNMEMGLNHEVRPKDPVDALGEIIWHLSALASIYEIRLSEIVRLTQDKATFRNPEKNPGPRHKEIKPNFPEKFDVHFVAQGERKAKMFLVEGNTPIKQLGAELTDNDHDGDGYRFHDVMHVAFSVHLGWSPNLRTFMGLKRKSDNAIDEIEDGGRAKILEECVILEVHLLAEKLMKSFPDSNDNAFESPFRYENALSFDFLRRLHELCKGHEVAKNPKQDWEKAIREGYDCYIKLKQNNGGIISAEMSPPRVSFIEFDQTNRLDYSQCL